MIWTEIAAFSKIRKLLLLVRVGTLMDFKGNGVVFRTRAKILLVYAVGSFQDDFR